MKKLLKIFIISNVVFFVVLVLLVIALKTFLTPERVKNTILPIARQQLGRDITLSGIDIDIFSGITLKGFEIMEKEGRAVFVSAKAASLHYDLLPLLWGKVVIDTVSLDKPVIRIKRYPGGRFNFSDLLEREGAGPSSQRNETGQKDRATGSLISLTVSRVRINNGLIEFTDYTTNSKEPFSYTIGDIELNASDISLSRSFPVDISFYLSGAPVRVYGKVDPSRKSASLSVDSKDIDGAALAKPFSKKIPGSISSMKIDTKILADIGPNSLSSSGRIEINGIDLSVDAIPEMHVAGARIGIDYNVDLSFPVDTVNISKLVLDLNGIPLQLEGKVLDLSGNKQSLDFSVHIPHIPVHKIIAAVPPKLVEGVRPFSLDGAIECRAKLGGSIDAGPALLQFGNIKIDGVSADLSGLRPVLSGIVNYNQGVLTAKNLSIGMHDSGTLFVDFSAEHLFDKPVIITAVIKSENLDVDKLLASMKEKDKEDKGGSKKASEKETAASGQVTKSVGPYDIPVTAHCDIGIKRVYYRGIEYKPLKARIDLEKNRLVLKNFYTGVDKGEIDGNGSLDLSVPGLAYNFSLMAREVPVEAFLAAFSIPGAVLVNGISDFDVRLAGKGVSAEEIKKNIFFDSKIKLRDAKIVSPGIVNAFAGFFGKKVGMDDTYEIASHIKMEKGKVHLDNTSFAGPDIRMSPAGSIGIDGTLDFAATLQVSPRLTAKLSKLSRISKYFVDKDGWVHLPVRVSGTVLWPSIRIDTSRTSDILKDKARTAIEKKIEKSLEKRLKPGKTGSDDDNSNTEKKIIEDVIKGFLGR